MNEPLRSCILYSFYLHKNLHCCICRMCHLVFFYYLHTSISGAGSDGNFDSYLQDVPKVGSDILNMVILGSFAASSAIVLTIYMYIKLHLRRKFHKVRGISSTFLQCLHLLWKYFHDCTNISVQKKQCWGSGSACFWVSRITSQRYGYLAQGPGPDPTLTPDPDPSLFSQRC
jgi:hypothetical protein